MKSSPPWFLNYFVLLTVYSLLFTLSVHCFVITIFCVPLLFRSQNRKALDMKVDNFITAKEK